MYFVSTVSAGFFLESRYETSGVCRNASAELFDRNQHSVLRFCRIQPQSVSSLSIFLRASSPGDAIGGAENSRNRNKSEVKL